MTVLRERWIPRTVEYVRGRLLGEGSGHDWFHTERVWRLSCFLADREGADRLTVELAALLHDIGDFKFYNGDETVGPRLAAEWLEELGADRDLSDRVCEIVATVSFKGAGVATPMRTLEGRVVQDADRLDAIGAVGIARVFAYGGSRGREIYNPAIPPSLHDSFAAYKRSAGPSINHFYEKLLLLKDRMGTSSARMLAEERHRFMETFLEQFFAELKLGEPGSDV